MPTPSFVYLLRFGGWSKERVFAAEINFKRRRGLQSTWTRSNDGYNFTGNSYP